MCVGRRGIVAQQPSTDEKRPKIHVNTGIEKIYTAFDVRNYSSRFL